MYTLELADEHAMLMCCFMIATWVVEKLPIAPCLALVGPPGSGKTTALRILNLVCRRSLLTADISSAAFYQLCNRLTPTLLIDETASMQNRRELLHLLRAGSTQDVISLRRGAAYRTYGARAVAWLELPDDAALNSRCIVIPMKSSTKKALYSPMDPKLLKYAASLRQALLRFRFSNYRNLVLPRLPVERELQPRTRDLYRALALPVGKDIDLCKCLLGLLERQESIRETLPRESAAILDAVFTAIHTIENGYGCRISALTEMANKYLRSLGESAHLSEKRVGNILTSFNFGKRSRTNVGYVQWFNREAKEQVHRLVSNHKANLSSAQAQYPGCEFCDAIANRDVRRSGGDSINRTESDGTTDTREHGERSERNRASAKGSRKKR